MMDMRAVCNVTAMLAETIPIIKSLGTLLSPLFGLVVVLSSHTNHLPFKLSALAMAARDETAYNAEDTQSNTFDIVPAPTLVQKKTVKRKKVTHTHHTTK
jgi:hypothetical protein